MVLKIPFNWLMLGTAHQTILPPYVANCRKQTSIPLIPASRAPPQKLPQKFHSNIAQTLHRCNII
jgi:hypothetical protein